MRNIEAAHYGQLWKESEGWREDYIRGSKENNKMTDTDTEKDLEDHKNGGHVSLPKKSSKHSIHIAFMVSPDSFQKNIQKYFMKNIWACNTLKKIKWDDY